MKSLLMKLSAIQPSQLYINSVKLLKLINTLNKSDMSPVPIKELNNDIIYTDGHTRALVYYLSGFDEIDVMWDEDELDWKAYTMCVKWCKEEGIFTIADLKDRIICAEDYRKLWIKRCEGLFY